MINDVFKTPVYQTELKLDNKAISLYCVHHSKKDEGRTISNSGGYQSNSLTGTIPMLNDLFENIIQHSNKMAKLIGLKPTQLTDVWININGYKDSNLSHIHSHCMLSGVYYVKTPENCGDLVLCNPATHMNHDWDDDTVEEELTNYTSSRCMMPARESTLYIFPSWLEHYVSPNMSEGKRISISFNMC